MCIFFIKRPRTKNYLAVATGKLMQLSNIDGAINAYNSLVKFVGKMD